MIVPFWPMVMTVPVVVPGVVAVRVNAPATVPARSVTRATPLELVSADPDGGLNPPVLSVVVKVTATFGAGRPLVSLTSACTMPGLVGEMVFVGFPDVSVSVRVMLDWPVGVVGVDVSQPGSSGLRLGSFTQVLPPPPPPQPDRTAIAVTTASHFNRLQSCATVTILVSLSEARGSHPTDGLAGRRGCRVRPPRSLRADAGVLRS